MKKYITTSYKQTQKIGEDFARELSSSRPASPSLGGKRGSRSWIPDQVGNDKRTGALVIALYGNLGGGKTTFLQGFAKGLGIKENVLSPTFVIMKKFKPQKLSVLTNERPSKSQDYYFYHFDCYRLNKAEDILELNFKEIISDPKNIVAIEWPEKIKKLLPKERIEIDFKFISENEREIIIKSF